MNYGDHIVHTSDLFAAQACERLLTLLRRDGFAVLASAWYDADEDLALTAAHRLFTLPVAQKARYRTADPRSPGYVEYGRTRAMDTGIPNLLEMWNLPGDGACGLPAPDATLGRAAAALRELAVAALAALERALALPGVLTAMLGDASYELYAMHYPQELLGQDERARRQSVHEDSSLITLLPRATRAGLWLDMRGELAPFDPRPGDVTIIVGSELEYVTAGSLRSCTHTVETPTAGHLGAERTSLVFFVSAEPDRTLRPLPPFQSAANRLRYPEITAGKFIGERYDSVYGE